MELPEHGRYAAAGDWLRAAGAQRATLGVIMRLAIRHSLVVEERAAVERLSAILQMSDDKKTRLGIINYCCNINYYGFERINHQLDGGEMCNKN